MLLDINNASDIHLRNILQVVLFTLKKKETTRRELATNLNLSSGTISSVCNLLLSLGFSEEHKLSNNLKGPKVKFFKMSQHVHYICILDIHNTATAKLYVLELNMMIIQSSEFPITSNLKSFLKELKSTYMKIPEDIRKKIIGISVAVSGTMYHKKNNIVSSLIPFLEGVSLEEKIQFATDIPVFVENESALAIAASIIKHEKSLSSCIYIFCDEGVGIGVIIKHNAIYGDNGLGSDICNIISPYSTTGETIEEVLSKQSIASFDKKGKTLGYLISILVNLLDINTIFIGGYIVDEISNLEKYVIEVQETLILHKDLREITLIPDENYEHTIVYGAYVLIIKNIVSRYKERSVCE